VSLVFFDDNGNFFMCRSNNAIVSIEYIIGLERKSRPGKWVTGKTHQSNFNSLTIIWKMYKKIYCFDFGSIVIHINLSII